MNESGTKRNKIKVCFLAYRDWALKAIKCVASDSNIEVIDIIESEDQYKEKVLAYPDGYVDCIILVGWSWIITDDILLRFLCVGMHPSDLPQFRGGSPIQHQIIAGLERTRISLMTISPNGVDVGDIWMKEGWSLTGATMKDILEELSDSTSRLLKRFFCLFDKLVPEKQNLEQGSYYKRRKPIDSKMSWEDLSKMQLKDVYNLIRALGDPYPNMYVEDQEGNRLLIKEAQYIPNNFGGGNSSGQI